MSHPVAVRLDLRRHRLDNGLRVVLHRDASLPLVSINVWYHVGSKHEAPGRTGFAHLFEHMLFQGSQHVGTHEHFRYVQQAGGVANGSTWYDRTNCYETLPRHQLDLGLWLESDRMGFLLPALTQEKLEKQREVVINERRQRVDNQPYGRAFERLHELLRPEGHPYRWPVIGYLEDLAAATLEEVRRFFRTFYVPNNAVLTLAGDVDDDALERIERYFGEIPEGAAVPAPEVPDAAPAGERRDVLHDRVKLERIYMAYPCPRYGEAAWYAADLLATALSFGRSSVFYDELVRRRQLAQDVTCFVYPTEETSCFVVVATARPGVEAARLEAAIDERLADVAGRSLPETELERARNQLLTDHFDSLQPLEQRADLLSRATTFFDQPERVEGEAERYRRIDAGDVAGFAARRLEPDRRAVVTVVPEERAA